MVELTQELKSAKDLNLSTLEQQVSRALRRAEAPMPRIFPNPNATSISVDY